MSFFLKLLKVISHKKYQKNPLGKKLSPLQQSVLNIGAVNAEHHFVIAYTDESIFFIPALPNPMTMKIMKYSGERGAGLGSLVSHTILGSDSADGVEMVPASAVSGVEIDEGARKVRIAVGDEVKKYQFKEKDCFGGDHEEALRDFFHFLRGIRG